MSNTGQEQRQELARTMTGRGELSVTPVSQENMQKLSVEDEGLIRRIVDPHQVRVEANLDANGIQVKIVGNAHFGNEHDLGRGQAARCRSPERDRYEVP
jgi:hypothetical protein